MRRAGQRRFYICRSDHSNLQSQDTAHFLRLFSEDRDGVFARPIRFLVTLSR